MVQCKKCGNTVDEMYKFCPECGELVGQEETVEVAQDEAVDTPAESSDLQSIEEVSAVENSEEVLETSEHQEVEEKVVDEQSQPEEPVEVNQATDTTPVATQVVNDASENQAETVNTTEIPTTQSEQDVKPKKQKHTLLWILLAVGIIGILLMALLGFFVVQLINRSSNSEITTSQESSQVVEDSSKKTSAGPINEAFVFVSEYDYGLIDKDFNLITELDGNASTQNMNGNLVVDGVGEQYFISSDGTVISEKYRSLLNRWATPDFGADADRISNYLSESHHMSFFNTSSDNKITKSGIVNADGEVVVESEEYLYNGFTNGFAVTEFAKLDDNIDTYEYGSEYVDKAISYGAVDENGEVILEAEYSYIRVLSNDYFMVRDMDDYDAQEFYVINRNKDVIIEKDRIDVRSLEHGLMAYYNGENDFGVYDENMKSIFETRFREMPVINEQGFIMGVEEINNELKGVIYDKSGKKVTEIQSNGFSKVTGSIRTEFHPSANGFSYVIATLNGTSKYDYQFGFVTNDGQVVYEHELKEVDNTSINAVQGGQMISLYKGAGENEVYDSKGNRLLADKKISNIDETIKDAIILYVENGEEIEMYLYNTEGQLLAEKFIFAAPAGEHLLVQYEDGKIDFIDRKTGEVIKSGTVTQTAQ